MAADDIINVPLRRGEIDLIRRAIRVWLQSERDAMHTAACARDPAHAADVRRQVAPRLEVGGALLDRLLHDPENRGTSPYRSKQ